MNSHYGYGKVLDDPFGSHNDTDYFFPILKTRKMIESDEYHGIS